MFCIVSHIWNINTTAEYNYLFSKKSKKNNIIQKYNFFI
jgi:hypothetical protein